MHSSTVPWENINPNDYTPLLGIAIGKKAKARKAQKQELKMAKKEAKVANINSKAQSRLELAKQGINMGTAVGNAIGSLATVATAVMGGSPQPADVTPVYAQQPLTTIGQTIGETAQAINGAANYGTPPYYPDGGGTPTYAGSNTAEEAERKKKEEEKKKKDQQQMFLFIGIGIAVLFLFFMMSQKNK